MKKRIFLVLLGMCNLCFLIQAVSQQQVLEGGRHHLRNAGVREWSEFPEHAERSRLTVAFTSKTNDKEKTISFRQYDVKLTWDVHLNGQQLGTLVADEKDLRAYIRIPPGSIHEGQNTLEFFCRDKQPDDILLGEVILYDHSREEILSQARLSLEILDKKTGQHIPGRITIVNGMGTLQSLSTTGDEPVAVRAGYVYSGSGKVQAGVPAGTYTLYATRGPEYGVDSFRIDVKRGDHLEHKFVIQREVQTQGWAASDTHIHTFTWSRHGDASVAERALTVAGEAIELPVMTDHNIHVDLRPVSVEQNVIQHYTPIVGNEVTTPVGHFNIFPLLEDSDVINHRADSWRTLETRMTSEEEPRAVILNHARDIHVNFRPFDPSRHLSSAGARLDRWNFFANAMEVINSGSQQTDQMELMRDWFAMLNHGHLITPVGCSDSHDVSRYIVGQARTYIRCNDEDPANIDINEAVKNFLEGNVTVSFGLFAEIEVNDAYGPGELVPGSDEVKIAIKASGPAWLRAERVTLYANGKKIRETEVSESGAAGVKWSGEWTLTAPQQDIFLVAVVDGPGDPLPFWPIAKPYQHVSTVWEPRVFALTGAVWIDGDRNGKRDFARQYAETLVRQAGSSTATLIESLAAFDEAVSIQAAALLYEKGKDLSQSEVTRALQNASPETRAAFQKVIADLKQATNDSP